MIVANPQLNAGNNTDPSIIFRPWEDKNQSMENQFGAGNKAGPSHQVKSEKEKNPPQEIQQPEATNQHEARGEKSFKNKLFNITYEPTNKKDIYKTGEQ